MKKFILLTVITALLLCGCGAQKLSAPPQTVIPPTEPPVTPLPLEIPPLPTAQQTEPTVPTTEPTVPTTEPTTPETEAPVEVTKPASNQVTAEDAFYQLYTNPNNGNAYCFHIPRLVWNGSPELLINDQIYFSHMRVMSSESYDDQPAIDSFWALGQANGYASVFSTFSPQEYDHTFHSVFHFNTATGQEASDDEILAAFGYTQESFYQEIRRVLEENYDKNNPGETDPEYEEMKTLQLSGSNIEICRPFIDARGRLCATNFSYGFSYQGNWYNSLCLQTGEPAIFNTTGCDHCG